MGRCRGSQCEYRTRLRRLFGPTPGIPYGEVEGLAYDPTSSEVLVSNSVWDNVSAISDATNNITGSFAVGTDPAGIAIDNRSGEVFVTDLGCPERLWVCPRKRLGPGQRRRVLGNNTLGRQLPAWRGVYIP